MLEVEEEEEMVPQEGGDAQELEKARRLKVMKDRFLILILQICR